VSLRLFVNATIAYWQANPNGGTQADLLLALQVAGFTSSQAANYGTRVIEALFDHAVTDANTYASVKTRLQAAGLMRMAAALRVLVTVVEAGALRVLDFERELVEVDAVIVSLTARLASLDAAVVNLTASLPTGPDKTAILDGSAAGRVNLVEQLDGAVSRKDFLTGQIAAGA
jgi:hypothetical protein